MIRSDRETGSSRPVLLAVRYVLPVAIVLTGIVLAIAGPSNAVMAAGVTLAGVGLLVALLNLLMRLAIRSGDDRRREEQARRFFDRHRRWPNRRAQ